MWRQIITNFLLAMEGIAQNKVRSLLTALGIIFGVFAVIAMMAIGNGAEKSIMEQLKIIGTNNIIISSVPPNEMEDEEEGESSQNDSKKSYTPGLNLKDVNAIINLLENEEAVSIEVGVDTKVFYNKTVLNTKCRGVNNDFFAINSLNIELGKGFNGMHHNRGDNVCILGANIAKKLFLGKDPVGKTVKCKHVIFQVIGVLENRLISDENYQNLGISNFGNQIFIPFQTYKLRIENKSRIGEEDILTRGRRQNLQNYHELEKVVVKVNEPTEVESSASVIGKLLARKHNDQIDYRIEIPELLIKQQQDTQETLNFVFAIIAGISLLVGGIGIMNIMLASVMERIKEIGIRRSLGATERDISLQFLLEAIAISLMGGFLGIFLGIAGSWVISQYADIPTVISFWSIFLSFGIAVGVGVIFGYMPAQKAAKMDPILALRTD